MLIYLAFLTNIVLLTVSLFLVSVPVVLGVWGLALALESRGCDRVAASVGFVSAALFQLFVGLSLGVVSRMFASTQGVGHPWLYAVTGFFAAYMVVGLNASRDRESIDSWAMAGAAVGGLTGLVGAMVLFWIGFAAPGLASVTPLFPWMLNTAIDLTNWLRSFWLIRVALIPFFFLPLFLGAAVMGTLAAWGLVQVGVEGFRRISGRAGDD